MGRVTALVFVGVLALQGNAGRGFSRADNVQFTEAEMAAAVITMSRENRCGSIAVERTSIGQCPDYTVTITGRGVVTYDGVRGVKTLGSSTHQVPAKAARELVESFLRAGFFNFKEGYQAVDHGGTFEVIDHAVETTVTLSIAKQTKRVVGFYGVPYTIRELERGVEEASDVRRYTGRPALPIGAQIVRGRVTSMTGTAVPDAKINMLGHVLYEAISDRTGHFQIDHVFPGTGWNGEYTFRAAAAGFITAQVKIPVKEGAPPIDWNPVLKPAR